MNPDPNQPQPESPELASIPTPEAPTAPTASEAPTAETTFDQSPVIEPVVEPVVEPAAQPVVEPVPAPVDTSSVATPNPFGGTPVTSEPVTETQLVTPIVPIVGADVSSAPVKKSSNKLIVVSAIVGGLLIIAGILIAVYLVS